MAYSKIVIWPSPYLDNQKLPPGSYGMRYTYVDVDVPLFEYSRDLWDLQRVFIAVETGDDDVVFYTATPYRRNTLKVFADGQPIPFKEDTKTKKKLVRVKIQDIENKDLYCSYVPFTQGEFLGDNKDRLEGVYGVIANVRYSTKVREVLHLGRQYIDYIAAAIDIEPPLWVGGANNQNIGSTDNLLPKLTPIDIDLHLVPINQMVDKFTNFLINRGVLEITALPEPAYTIEYMEAMQKALIDIDAGMYKVLN